VSAYERMADHWWWRPGWAPGRRFYTWHLTFDAAAQMHRLAEAYRLALVGVPGLDLVPDRWLHLTMQGLGFVGEVDGEDVDAIVSAAGKHLAALRPFDMTMARPALTPEAIRWDPDSDGPAAVRAAIRDAIGEVWTTVPEQADGFGAHVTIAYSSADGSALPVYAALNAVDAEAAVARVTHADLIILGRDRRMYEWETYASVPLGAD
jgi:2'-5' RNA ligase